MTDRHAKIWAFAFLAGQARRLAGELQPNGIRDWLPGDVEDAVDAGRCQRALSDVAAMLERYSEKLEDESAEAVLSFQNAQRNKRDPDKR